MYELCLSLPCAVDHDVNSQLWPQDGACLSAAMLPTMSAMASELLEL